MGSAKKGSNSRRREPVVAKSKSGVSRKRGLPRPARGDAGGDGGGGYFTLASPSAEREQFLLSHGLVEFSTGTREDAHALGEALEAARAEEKRAAQGGGSGEQSLTALPLLRRAEQDLGPLSVLDVLVPGLRTLNQRVVVLEDKEKRLDLFKCWFTNYDLACTKVVREGIELLRMKQADYLFLDFDIHDPGDHTLREYLRVQKDRRELDGLDLAYYVTKRLPVELRPKNIIIHSRNPMGRRLMKKHLEERGVTPTMWAFNYGWQGPDDTAPRPPPPTPPKKSTPKMKKQLKACTTPNFVTNEKDLLPASDYFEKLDTSDWQPKKYPVGTKVRFTGVFLKSTGQIAGEEGQKWFTVMECACSLCTTGDYLAVDEPNVFDEIKYRHIAVTNLYRMGELTVRNDP